MASASPYVIDADDSNFEQLAIEGSRARPVVVDFWAEWCGPCRTLGPLLEALAEEFAGAFLLVKVDTERAPRTAQQWNIRSIPAVVGLRNREVVAEFVGAQPEAAIRSFLSSVIPKPADLEYERAMDLAREGRAEKAEQAFRVALELDAGHPAASIGLGHLLLTRGEFEAANEVAEAARFGTPLDSEVERLRSALRLRSASGGDLESLRAAVEAAPKDPAKHIAHAAALAAEGHDQDALDAYLEAVRLDAAFEDEAARKAMLDLFDVLGSDHDLTREYRGKLARLLYR